MSLEMDLRGNTGTKFQPPPPNMHLLQQQQQVHLLVGWEDPSNNVSGADLNDLWHGRESADDANYFYFYTYPFPFVIVAVVFHVAVSLVTLLRSYDGF